MLRVYGSPHGLHAPPPIQQITVLNVNLFVTVQECEHERAANAFNRAVEGEARGVKTLFVVCAGVDRAVKRHLRSLMKEGAYGRVVFTAGQGG